MGGPPPPCHSNMLWFFEENRDCFSLDVHPDPLPPFNRVLLFNFEKKSALSCQKQPVTTNPMIFKSGKVYDTLTPLKLCCALRYLQPPLPSEKLTTKLVFVLTLFFIYP